jgi:hypothetical protein
VPGCPAVAPGGRGSTGPEGSPSWSSCLFWLSAGREGLQAGDRVGDPRGPGPVPGKAEPQAASAAGQAADDGEQAQPQPLRFPPAGGAGQGEHLGPGQQLAGQRDDLAPQLVLREPLQRQVPQPGILRAADPVLALGLPYPFRPCCLCRT